MLAYLQALPLGLRRLADTFRDGSVGSSSLSSLLAEMHTQYGDFVEKQLGSSSTSELSDTAVIVD